MASILTKLKNKYISMRGFTTDRKLLVIESDDWGSIRMPSQGTFRNLQKQGDHPECDAFLRNDSLESIEDLSHLYEVLSCVADKNGNPAVLTANFAMANPNFDKIDYENNQYSYEPFYETYRRYYGSLDVLETVKLGIQKRVFYPQLHCREHMNVNRWMHALKNKKSDALLAFENKMIGVNSSFSQNNRFGYMDAFNTDQTTIGELEKILCDAIKLFEDIFGFQSKTFVASCFVWANEFEAILAKHGILGIQSDIWQQCPAGKSGEYKLKRKLHYTGQKNVYNQIFTVRNCMYEPSYGGSVDECLEKCFVSVCNSFKNKKPAIISSHRLNYIGSINPQNATNNLQGLKKLLKMIKREFPDVEFVSSSDLFEIIYGALK